VSTTCPFYLSSVIIIFVFLMETEGIRLGDDSVWTDFKLCKVFQECTSQVDSLEFDDSGSFLIAGCAGDASIRLYDAVEGRLRKTVFSKKYGVGPLCFTHHSNTVLYGSSKSSSDPIESSTRFYFRRIDG